MCEDGFPKPEPEMVKMLIKDCTGNQYAVIATQESTTIGCKKFDTADLIGALNEIVNNRASRSSIDIGRRLHTVFGEVEYRDLNDEVRFDNNAIAKLYNELGDIKWTT